MAQVTRRKTQAIKVGTVCIGDSYPIAIQSMTKTRTADIEKTLGEIGALKKAGCEIVRLAIKDSRDARALKMITQGARIPVVADIHFDWRLALAAIDNGADKIRLNPGNIYKKDQVREIARAAKASHVPIRVGLNSGSVIKGKASGSPAGRQKGTGKNLPAIMVEEALRYIKILEGSGFYDIVISLKASDIRDTVEAYRKMARHCDYPFHLGVTATGAARLGTIKSSIAVGALLLEGIGDTIRVSLTASPREEVASAKAILEATGLRHFGPEIISCPTCGRCEVDLVRMVKDFEKKLQTARHMFYGSSLRPFKIAIMGCVVNGPGEARQADVGIAFGKKEGLLFRKGSPVKKVSLRHSADILLEEARKLATGSSGL
jgi:(E)-4-hydroxy-3-methylbut-2-enyl-diphosphate synthase